MRLGDLTRRVVGLLVCSVVLLAGCGGPATEGQVSNDTAKDPALLDAMGSYMNKRFQGKGAKKAAKPAKGAQAAPGEAASG